MEVENVRNAGNSSSINADRDHDRIDDLLAFLQRSIDEFATSQPHDTALSDSANQSSARMLAALMDLTTRLADAPDEQQGANRLADLIHDLFPRTCVYVGLVSKNRQNCKLAAISNQLSIDREDERCEMIESTFLEVIHRGEPGQWPPKQDSRHALMAHRRLAERLGVAHLSSVALIDDRGDAVGAVLFAVDEPGGEPALERLLAAAAKPVARTLGLLRRVRPSRLSRLGEKMARFVTSRRGRLIAFALILACSLLFVPVPYRIGADVELQPVTRRFVTTPFETRLLHSMAEPGDVVESGQLVAKLDGREIEIELAVIDAELHQAEKEHAGYLARHESGPAEIARLEIERVRHRRDLLQQRLEQLDIRSPVRGVVISGDLSRSIGIPLQVGEALYEIAPLDSMIVEIAIPERDIRLIEEGTDVDFRLDAFPHKRFSGEVRRIYPRAELFGDANVFIAELEMSSDGELRPGMQGRAQLDGGSHPLGWILFHRAVYSIQVTMGW